MSLQMAQILISSILAIGSAASAVAAWRAAYLNNQSVKEAREEKHKAVKPYLQPIRTTLNSEELIYEIVVENKGYEIFHPISIKWEGNEDVNTKLLIETGEGSKLYKFHIEYSKLESEHTGNIKFTYRNIYNKFYEERIEGVILAKHFSNTNPKDFLYEFLE